MTALDHREIEDVLRAALRARATRLALDPNSITSPSQGALTARGLDGSLFRLDYRIYRLEELTR